MARSTHSAFNYWMRAGLLNTEFTSTTPGVARRLNRENVHELAMMAVLTDMGTSPKHAQSQIRRWVINRSGELPNFLVRRYDEATWFPADNMTMGELARQLPPGIDLDHMDEDDPRWTEQVAAGYSTINLGEIERRVDELFEDSEPEAEDGP